MKYKVYIMLIAVMAIMTTITIFLILEITNTPKKVIIQEKEITKKEEPIDWKRENIVFLGDSITEIYPISEIFGNLPIVKSGVSGYTTQDILDRMNSMVYQYNPTKVFLLIGTNDIMNDTKMETREKLVDNIKKIIENIKSNKKNAKIYLESIYPINRNMKKEMVAERNNGAIIDINKRLKKYCEDNSITFINMHDELLDKDGNFDEKYTYDGLHPNTLGYAKISLVRSKYIYNIENSEKTTK